MNDTELDQRLGSVADATNNLMFRDALNVVGRDAADSVLPHDSSRTRTSRWRWHPGILVAAGAVMLLTAGTTATAYYLKVPPFQSLDPGALRTNHSIPMDFTTHNGVHISCRIFLEFTGVSSHQVDEVDDAIAARDWTGFGQGLYDAQTDLPPAPPRSESLSPQDPVEAAELPAVYAFAKSVIPGLNLLGAGGPGSPALSSVDETCLPSAQ